MNRNDILQQLRDLAELPVRFGDTVPLSDVLRILHDAGLPATISRFNEIRLADGRRARIATPNPLPPVHRKGGTSDGPDLILWAVPTATPEIVQVAELARGLLLVDVATRRVWDRGRITGRPGPFLGRGIARYALFAVARTILTHSVETMGLAEMTGLQLPDAVEALSALRDHVHHADQKWQANTPDALIDFLVDDWPGAGGVLTTWASFDPLPTQATQLLAQPGVVLSGRWAGHQMDARVTGNRIVAYTPAEIDMPSLGFRPAQQNTASVTLVYPEDPTIFATARYSGPPGCADDFITAANLARSAHTRDERDEADFLRHHLHTLYDHRPETR